jgi:hypothetical protein
MEEANEESGELVRTFWMVEEKSGLTIFDSVTRACVNACDHW